MAPSKSKTSEENGFFSLFLCWSTITAVPTTQESLRSWYVHRGHHLWGTRSCCSCVFTTRPERRAGLEGKAVLPRYGRQVQWWKYNITLNSQLADLRDSQLRKNEHAIMHRAAHLTPDRDHGPTARLGFLLLATEWTTLVFCFFN